MLAILAKSLLIATRSQIAWRTESEGTTRARLRRADDEYFWQGRRWQPGNPCEQ